MVSTNIHQSSHDNDVMTDEEMIECAKKVLNKEIEKAIKQFNNYIEQIWLIISTFEMHFGTEFSCDCLLILCKLDTQN